ncbi:hypothetical protein [Clostridium kluyveri]|uniref:Transcriptional regulator n=1 Tax=Clostridium kluyveri (strain ATCC 8527 / DSM 555 / NBRC 12016 / NCIMB 10680 / K1) TaxID=431943 RepID=A5N2G4_CLOK5|nr:hypothetical protein [Clostridium kluyveri]EDK35310.1 Hypothetical protein CKL_3307 [Clostridium kluyveri DSM 555]
MRRAKAIDVNRAIELYNKYGSLNRAALSVDCAPTTLKNILIENGVEIKRHKAPRWGIAFGKQVQS